MKKIAALIAFIAVFVLTVLSVLAGHSLADGAQATHLTIHKTVLNPQSNRFVDNMGFHDVMFHPGDPITFHITIGNTGNGTILQVIIKDVFPQYVTFVSAPGNYDASSNTLTILTLNLSPNTTQTFSISGKIKDANLLPNQKTICDTNKANASSNNNQNVQDTAQFCITNPSTESNAAGANSGSSIIQPQPKPEAHRPLDQKADQSLTETQTPTIQPSQNTQKVFPPVSNTTTTPATGAEDLALALPLISALAGILLRNKKIV